MRKAVRFLTHPIFSNQWGVGGRPQKLKTKEKEQKERKEMKVEFNQLEIRLHSALKSEAEKMFDFLRSQNLIILKPFEEIKSGVKFSNYENGKEFGQVFARMVWYKLEDWLKNEARKYEEKEEEKEEEK